jgi:hypothetical protein
MRYDKIIFIGDIKSSEISSINPLVDIAILSKKNSLKTEFIAVWVGSD